MTAHGGRVIRTTYPCVCEDCHRVIPTGYHALWDGGATCLPCVVKSQGVVPMTDEELDLSAQEAEDQQHIASREVNTKEKALAAFWRLHKEYTVPRRRRSR